MSDLLKYIFKIYDCVVLKNSSFCRLKLGVSWGWSDHSEKRYRPSYRWRFGREYRLGRPPVGRLGFGSIRPGVGSRVMVSSLVGERPSSSGLDFGLVLGSVVGVAGRQQGSGTWVPDVPYDSSTRDPDFLHDGRAPPAGTYVLASTNAWVVPEVGVEDVVRRDGGSSLDWRVGSGTRYLLPAFR